MLVESIGEYVSKRRAEGCQFVNSESILKAFSRHCGAIEVSALASWHVESFLDKRPQLKSVTNASRFSVVRCFFEHLARKGEIEFVQLSAPAKPNAFRQPFIYALQDVRSLLRATEECQSESTIFASSSFRMLILILYSTGAGLGETLALTRNRVDLRHGEIEFLGGRKRVRRIVPIGKTLKGELSEFLAGSALPDQTSQLIRRSDGKAATQKYLASRFRRLLSLAGFSHAAECAPRLQDFRYTFAVHSLTTWLQAKRDENSLLPALSTYMGYSDLGAAERFVALTPERFRKELERLSPSSSERTRGRNQAVF